MFLSQLKLTNFRMFEDLQFDLPTGPIIILGNNGQGKTSILESIYLLAISRAFRAENEREVVNWKTIDSPNPTIVDAVVHGLEGRTRVIIGYHILKKEEVKQNFTPTTDHFSVKKEIRVGGVKRNASSLIGFVTAVLFSAQDINLVLGPPSTRRKFLDILISQSNRKYFRTLQKYQRGLKQRNSILRAIKNGTSQYGELEFWDDLLITEGLTLMFQRMEVLSRIGVDASNFLWELTNNNENLSVVYHPTIKLGDTINDTREVFRNILLQSRQRDIQVGTTQFGPHKDDFELSVNNSDMRLFSSRGQARTIALALRLAEASHISSPQSEPLILLDDILSELDKQRRQKILTTIAQYKQLIITTTNLTDFEDSFLKRSNIFGVHQGKITPYQHDVEGFH
ncbi:DNA replication/repair protein RecF [SAR202 cluster bacterium AC-409-J13_OGT_754m]|nr:DNA replication/repair protein RecF [SAR202 cluster bacterium AC-409-J13_OGT_754m]